MIESKQIDVNWGCHQDKVWVAGAFDSYLETFAEEISDHLSVERCPFGVLLWPCARTLAQVLSRRTDTDAQAPLKIADLGCGVGFISCVLARLYPQAEIWACDYEQGLQSFVEQNATDWGVKQQLGFHKIDWRQSPSESMRGSFDWVVGTDIFYDDSHLQHVPTFAAALLKPQGRLTLADPQRDRFSQALRLLSEQFELKEHLEIPCSMHQEGIEDFMINAGIEQQLISILQLQKHGRSP